MSEYCTNHPARMALSFCYNCKRYFCSECLHEKGDYYYCSSEECMKAVPPLPETIHCPLCNEYLHLSESERSGRQFICPTCHKLCNYSTDDGTLAKFVLETAPMREYANVLTRFGAIAIDSLLMGVFYVPALLMMESPSTGPIQELTAALLALVMVGFGIWNGIIRMGKTGQSLGRKFLNIAVLDEQGRPIGIGRAFLREIIGRWASAIVCYLGYLNAFWDKKKQMWHDKIANCYVYYVEDGFS